MNGFKDSRVTTALASHVRIDSHLIAGYDSRTMARYITRICPRCREYFGVTIRFPSSQSREPPISAWCAGCGYELEGSHLIVGRDWLPNARYRWMREGLQVAC